ILLLKSLVKEKIKLPEQYDKSKMIHDINYLENKNMIVIMNDGKIDTNDFNPTNIRVTNLGKYYLWQRRHQK
ncbi:MAG: hypothetical protein ABSG15_06995, partial [FCB group bacterium]